MKILSNQQINFLESSLNAASMKQKIISNNIANVDTPHYKSKAVNFEDTLRTAIEGQSTMKTNRTNDKHIPFSTDRSNNLLSPTVFTKNNTNINNSGNNVDIDLEMSEMAKNQMLYNALIQQTSGYFTKLQSVIKDGR